MNNEDRSFWLVAFVVCWLLIMCAAFLGSCMIWHDGSCQSSSGRFNELLQTILASVLAFASGRASK